MAMINLPGGASGLAKGNALGADPVGPSGTALGAKDPALQRSTATVEARVRSEQTSPGL